MSAVTWPPAHRSEPVWRIFPLWKIETLVEPPPSSMMAQPELDLVRRQHAEGRREGLQHELRDMVPGPLDAFPQVLQDARQNSNEIYLGFQPRARHPDRLVDPALLVDQVVLGDGVQQLVVAAEADVARHVVDPGDVAGRGSRRR